ncbi:hypothetical protein F9K91_24880 [Brucella tritici]|uniref:Uncharacterized protein n=1 Tax=Brucella tritici TaxID=94626 RepID=A0A833CH92_9HYPH|nr:hypothetical protein [Brucella tritici]KAB2661436.1 hypothetical protein F9K91_24880 [Brucella tritici]
MKNAVLIHKDGEEGGFHIDGQTGKVMTSADERPLWAENYAVALLGERTGWFEQRLGQHLPDGIRKPQIMDVRELGWIAFDEEGDEVEVEADTDYRMDVLAKLLDVDRMDFDQERNFKRSVAQAEVDHTYRTQPTDEATLAEVEGLSFQELENKTGTYN